MDITSDLSLSLNLKVEAEADVDVDVETDVDFGTKHDITDNIHSLCWDLAIAFLLSDKLLHDIIPNPSPYDDLAIVATEYGHISYKLSQQRYTHSWSIILSTLNYTISIFKLSPFYKKKSALLKKIKQSSSFSFPSSSISPFLFYLNNIPYSSSSKFNLNIYHAWFIIHNPILSLYKNACKNTISNVQAFLAHLELTWSQHNIHKAAIRFKNNINLLLSIS